MSDTRTEQPPVSRWLQLVLGVICMVMIANLQYGWTLFVTPIDQAHGWGRASIQVAFTIFVLMQTWLVPVEGWLIDKFGPRIAVCLGGFCVGAAWLLNSIATASRCSMSARPSAASARAWSTQPPLAMPSSGFRTAAALPQASSRVASAAARRLPSSRSPT